jgi:hypothetical protein
MSDTALATPSTPAAAPSAPSTPSAPATSGAPSTPAKSSLRAFHEAFERNPVGTASPADIPASSGSPEPPASATTVPGSDPTAAVTPAPGPIPFERHKQVLDNAYKERDSFKTQFESLKQQLESPDSQRLRQWADSFRTNPEQWFASTIAELAAVRPDLVPNFRSQAARYLASRQAPAESFEPDIPVYNEHGQMVAQTYSADKVKSLVQQAVAAALQTEVTPLKQDFQQRQAVEQQRQILYEANQTATSQFEEAKTWPGFIVDAAKGTVDADCAKAFAEHQDWSLERAYIATVVPKLRAKEQAQVLDELKTKAAASTGVNPAGAAVASSRRPRDFNDPSLKWT